MYALFAIHGFGWNQLYSIHIDDPCKSWCIPTKENNYRKISQALPSELQSWLKSALGHSSAFDWATSSRVHMAYQAGANLLGTGWPFGWTPPMWKRGGTPPNARHTPGIHDKKLWLLLIGHHPPFLTDNYHCWTIVVITCTSKKLQMAHYFKSPTERIHSSGADHVGRWSVLWSLAVGSGNKHLTNSGHTGLAKVSYMSPHVSIWWWCTTFRFPNDPKSTCLKMFLLDSRPIWYVFDSPNGSSLFPLVAVTRLLLLHSHVNPKILAYPPPIATTGNSSQGWIMIKVLEVKRVTP